METTMPVERLLQINQDAVEAMAQGNNKKACDILASALQILETNPLDVVLSHETNEAALLPSGISRLPADLSNSAPPSTLHDTCCVQDSAHRTMEQPASHEPSERARLRWTAPLPAKDRHETLTTAIYNRAFLLHKGAQNTSLTAAILMFNQGLSCHLLGLSTGASTPLKDALYHYSQAYHIVLQESYILQHTLPTVLMEDRSATRLVVLLAAALCHNMAAVHGDFWNFAEARLLRCQLAQVIQWEGSQFSQMETDDFVFFHLGIFFAILDDFRVAPSA